MPDSATQHSAEVHQAYVQHERDVWIHNFRVACIIALIFVPAGISLDLIVYPHNLGEFFLWRMLCSACLLFIWWFVTTPFGRRNYRVLGWILPALPSFFISLMIFRTQGSVSPYYAGLNLVLLGAAIILRWTLLDSMVVFTEVLVLYLLACLLNNKYTDNRIFFNNFYFLFVTGVFVVIGSYFYNRLRLREFALRFELDRNKQALEESNQKLVELDQIKSRFFANISHELRTPLTLLLAPLETLMQKFNRSLDNDTREVLSTMHSNGMRLLKLINDLLDLVRLESGRLEVKHESLNVVDFVKGLASAARQVADDKRLRLETIVDPELGSVIADRDKLEKIVLNLVFNALKFTPAGGKVELRAEKKENSFVVTVADTGMGISAKNLPFVFDRFWQADGTSKRKYQGVGIGLALVKELTEIQGGKWMCKAPKARARRSPCACRIKKPNCSRNPSRSSRKKKWMAIRARFHPRNG